MRYENALACILVLAASTAGAFTEPKTGTAYPDAIVMETPSGPATLRITGAGLREKTILKVDVYTIASYVDSAAALGGRPAPAIRDLELPKRLQMDLRRGFSREKLIDSFVSLINANYADTSPFAADLDEFLTYFVRDARTSDRIVFDYVPGIGLTTTLNGEVKGVIENPAFMNALWSVWFGKICANEHLQRALVSAVRTAAAG